MIFLPALATPYFNALISYNHYTIMVSVRTSKVKTALAPLGVSNSLINQPTNQPTN
jgi:hypothetical protein